MTRMFCRLWFIVMVILFACSVRSAGATPPNHVVLTLKESGIRVTDEWGTGRYLYFADRNGTGALRLEFLPDHRNEEDWVHVGIKNLNLTNEQHNRILVFVANYGQVDLALHLSDYFKTTPLTLRMNTQSAFNVITREEWHRRYVLIDSTWVPIRYLDVILREQSKNR